MLNQKQQQHTHSHNQTATTTLNVQKKKKEEEEEEEVYFAKHTLQMRHHNGGPHWGPEVQGAEPPVRNQRTKPPLKLTNALPLSQTTNLVIVLAKAQHFRDKRIRKKLAILQTRQLSSSLQKDNELLSHA